MGQETIKDIREGPDGRKILQARVRIMEWKEHSIELQFLTVYIRSTSILIIHGSKEGSHTSGDVSDIMLTKVV